jgi:hypothetical protein
MTHVTECPTQRTQREVELATYMHGAEDPNNDRVGNKSKSNEKGLTKLANHKENTTGYEKSNS